MSLSANKEDLRSIKTKNAVTIAMFSLIKTRRFSKITVRDICEEAMISRATFYAHFINKYELLKVWLLCLAPQNLNDNLSYEQAESIINQFITQNAIIMKNVFYEADGETVQVLFDSILSIVGISMEEECGKSNVKYVVLSNFFAGGVFHYLLWQIEHRFPQEVPTMNKYLYEVIEKLLDFKN